MAFNESGDPSRESMNAFDAKEALRSGDINGLRRYLDELGRNLESIAEFLDPKDDQPADLPREYGASEPFTKNSPQPIVQDRDWDGDSDDLALAIEHEKPALIAAYLRDAGGFTATLCRVLDPDRSAKEPGMLAFMFRKRGKPHSVPWDAAKGKTNIRMQVLAAERRFGKREAAVAHVMEKMGISRATVFNALSKKKP